jgi:hypothetical protein
MVRLGAELRFGDCDVIAATCATGSQRVTRGEARGGNVIAIVKAIVKAIVNGVCDGNSCSSHRFASGRPCNAPARKDIR